MYYYNSNGTKKYIADNESDKKFLIAILQEIGELKLAMERLFVEINNLKKS